MGNKYLRIFSLITVPKIPPPPIFYPMVINIKQSALYEIFFVSYWWRQKKVGELLTALQSISLITGTRKDSLERS